MSKQVLIIDDLISIRSVLRRWIQTRLPDVEVLVADPHEGLRLAALGHADLIITDYDMGALTGADICHAAEGRGIPCIIFSGNANNANVKSSTQNAIAHIEKSNFEELLPVVEAQFSLNEVRKIIKEGYKEDDAAINALDDILFSFSHIISLEVKFDRRNEMFVLVPSQNPSDVIFKADPVSGELTGFGHQWKPDELHGKYTYSENLPEPLIQKMISYFKEQGYIDNSDEIN